MLLDTQSELETAKSIAEDKVKELAYDLDAARSTISLLEEQKQKLYETIQEYGKKEETWREDRLRTDELAQVVKDTEADLEFMTDKAYEYRDAWQASVAEGEAGA